MSVCEILPQVVIAVKAGYSTDDCSSYIALTIINRLPQHVMNVTANNPSLSQLTPYMHNHQLISMPAQQFSQIADVVW